MKRHCAGSLHSALASARRVREVLRLPRENGGHAAAQPGPRVHGDVRFENVSFSYRQDSPVLDHLNFVVPPGETVALVGRSGGKTPILSLLGRLYEPSSGRVLIDGVDVRTMSVRALRQQIAVVPQESILLSGTNAENILYCNLSAGRSAVEDAAHAAGCDDFIAALPLGLDTPLGEAGTGLSGGQRQRISIARTPPPRTDDVYHRSPDLDRAGRRPHPGARSWGVGSRRATR